MQTGPTQAARVEPGAAGDNASAAGPPRPGTDAAARTLPMPDWALVRATVRAPETTTTTTAPPPATTTTEPAPPPTTTTTEPPPPPTTTTTAPARRVLSSSVTGQATWYAEAPAGYCASPWLPFGTSVYVVNDATGASTSCVVDDREAAGPPRILDMSPSGFAQIADTSQGVATVTISW